MEILFLLLATHALCDFAFQSEAMGLGKSRKRNQSTGAESEGGFPPWYAWLAAHAFIHGGGVAVVTGLWPLGLIEAMLHAVIDHTKCQGRITFVQDQALHVICKLGYVIYLA